MAGERAGRAIVLAAKMRICLAILEIFWGAPSVHWLDSAASDAKGLESVFEKSGVSLTLADMRLPDAPLIGVNAAFGRLSGYDPQQVVGRNCRFLQPPGGAGPVRARMRDFLTNPTKDEDRFVVPNVTRDGDAFLNLVYMAKLRKNGAEAFVLGSQFNISEKSDEAVDMYDVALREDIVKLGHLAGEKGLVMMGTYNSLASSHSIIAKARIEGWVGQR